MPEYKTDALLGLAYEKAIALNRKLVIALMCLSFVCVGLAFTSITLASMSEVKPYFIPITKPNDQYYRIIPAENLSKHQLSELVRDYLQRYVINRHSIDEVTEIIRFKEVMAQSSANVFAQVKNEYNHFKKAQPDIKREIRIISDIQLEPYYHQVEFETIDKTPDFKEYKKTWVVNIRYTLAGFNAPEIKINAEEMDDNPNPLGLTVVAYNWTERKGE